MKEKEVNQLVLFWDKEFVVATKQYEREDITKKQKPIVEIKKGTDDAATKTNFLSRKNALKHDNEACF